MIIIFWLTSTILQLQTLSVIYRDHQFYIYIHYKFVQNHQSKFTIILLQGLFLFCFDFWGSRNWLGPYTWQASGRLLYLYSKICVDILGSQKRTLDSQDLLVVVIYLTWVLGINSSVLEEQQALLNSDPSPQPQHRYFLSYLLP